MFIFLSFFMTIWNIILFLIVLGLVICIHELGHLFFAKRAGILCHEFSFGMGPKLWSIKKGETTYSIRAIPFGGFVSMAGEELEEEVVKIGDKVRLGFDQDNLVNRIVLNDKNPEYKDFLLVTVERIDLKSDSNLYINDYEVKQDAFYVSDKNQLQIAPINRRFTGKTKLQRFLATFGGPFMNFVLAFFVYLIIAFSIGVPNGSSTVVSEVGTELPASSIIEEGDRIVSINGVDVSSWTGETNSVSSELAKTYDSYIFEVERDGSIITLETIKPQLLFYGLGFTSDSSSDDLIIETPLYLKSELLPGDELLSINGQTMNEWDDVIAFANANLEGSKDKQDLYDFRIFRETKTFISGTVTEIETEGGNYLVTVFQSEAVFEIYKFSTDETLLVQIGDEVEELDLLGDGAEYTFSYIIYGEDVLNVMNAEAFSTRIGISGTSKFSFFGSFGQAWELLVAAGLSIFRTLYLLFTSNLIGVSDLSGFVGIFSMTSQAASQGIITLLSFIGLLSVNLGIINLLPIPALDGGRIVFLGYEAITKKKPNQKVENWLHTIVFFLLIALMVYVTYNDILRLIGI